jgi:NADH-quinone oxidoreductase subunit N
MIAYSSIAHAGYLFFALLGDGSGRWEAIVFYLVAYGLMTVLVFAALPRGADDERQDQLDALKGLYGRRPFAAVMIAIAMLSLAGLPPLPGFVAKFLVFRNVLDAGHVGLAVAGLVASYLGLYFYLRVIQYMFMNEPEPSAARGRPRRYAVLASVLCLVPALLLMFFPGWLLDRL